MKIALAVVVVALLVLTWRLNSTNAALVRQQQTLSQQQQQIQTLHRDLSDKSTQEALTLQTECSEMASKYFARAGGNEKRKGLVDYRNHFNSKLKKCFILVSGYLPNDDFVTIGLYDAVEGRHYATFNGHSICNAAITGNPKKCVVDSGSIWFDGNDSRNPADFTVGFRGLLYGGGAGDENTQKTFLDHVEAFMSE
jgi:hypothetical protein